MQYEMIDETEAPAKPKEMSKKARASLALINALTPGKVAKVTVPEGENLRGVKLSLSRVGALNNRKVETWDDGSYVYVKLAD